MGGEKLGMTEQQRWAAFEAAKRRLAALGLSSAEHEKAVRELLRKFQL